MRLKLKIEPIPAFTWGVSLAQKLSQDEWKDLRQRVYRDANYICEICGETNRTLHCHEVWEFNDRRGIQKLVKLECCCELCHDVHHLGRTREVKSLSYMEICIKHWCKVNKKDKGDFIEYEQSIREVNYRRVNIHYIVKIGRRILV